MTLTLSGWDCHISILEPGARLLVGGETNPWASSRKTKVALATMISSTDHSAIASVLAKM